MFTINVRCTVHETEIENVSWYPTDHGEFVFEFDNCPKAQIVGEHNCEAKVTLFDNDHYKDDVFVAEHKIAEFNSVEYI